MTGSESCVRRGQPALRSVDSESQSHAIELRKTNRGSLCFSDVRGHAAAPQWSGVAVPPESTEHGQTDIGVLQELGRSCRLLSEIPAGDTGLPTPGFNGALVRWGAKRTSARGGTAKRRQRSAAGWAAGSRSALIVPLKQGNSPRRALGREAKRRPADPSTGNRWSTLRLRSLSTERARIASGPFRDGQAVG